MATVNPTIDPTKNKKVKNAAPAVGSATTAVVNPNIATPGNDLTAAGSSQHALTEAQLKQERENKEKQRKLWGILLTLEFYKTSTATELAEKVKRIEVILGLPALDKNHTDANGKSSLDYAMEARNFHVALILLVAGVRKIQKNMSLFPDANGKNILDYAIEQRDLAGIMILISMIDLSAQNFIDLGKINEGLRKICSDPAFPLALKNVQSVSYLSQRVRLMQMLTEERKMEKEKQALANWQGIKTKIDACLKELEKNIQERKKAWSLNVSGEVGREDNIIQAMLFQPQFKNKGVEVAEKSIDELKAQYIKTLMNTHTCIKSIENILSGEADFAPFMLSYFIVSLKKQDTEEEDRVNAFVASFNREAKEKVLAFLNAHRIVRSKIIDDIKRLIHKITAPFYNDVRRFCTVPGSNPPEIAFRAKSCDHYKLHKLKQFDIQREGQVLKLEAAMKLFMTVENKAEVECCLSITTRHLSTIYEEKKDCFSKAVSQFPVDDERAFSVFGAIFSCSMRFLEETDVDVTLLVDLIVEKLEQSHKNIVDSKTRAEQFKSMQQSFIELLAKDRRTSKSLEGVARNEKMIQFEREKMAKERERQIQLEKKRLEQVKEAHKAQIVAALKNLNGDNLNTVEHILTTGSHNNLHTQKLIALFGSQHPNIPPFAIQDVSKGYKITFDNQVLASFHHQHGAGKKEVKPIHESVFNAIREKFSEYGITLEVFQEMSAEFRRQSSSVSTNDAANATASTAAMGPVRNG